ncbi:MAG: ABC transporter substrate-binding protein [Candidatus Tectimicrobiota bacterium]|nr:MAG: ABC transporter substrate-binding protein [Candidatus Tectomicrobia bacterium]
MRRLANLLWVIILLPLGYAASSLAQSEPIRIGVLYPLGGPAAIYSKPALVGHELARDEINAEGGVLGRPLEFLVRDTKVKPDVAVREARALVLKDRVDFLMGGLSSAVGLAISEVAREHRVLIVQPIPKSSAITEERGHRYVVRTASNTVIEGRAAAVLAAKNPQNRRIYTISLDYEYGHKVTEAFIEHLRRLNPAVEIVGQAWPRLGETQYTNFITAILEAQPDLVYSSLWGGHFVAFVKQANPLGYFQRLRHLNVAEAGSVEVCRTLGEEMPAGIISNAYDVPEFPDTPAHRRYVEAYTKRAPYASWGIQGYIATYFLAAAIEKAGTTDTEKVIDAFEGLTIDTPIGPQTIRAFDHQASRGQVWGVITCGGGDPPCKLDHVEYIGAEGLWNSVEEIKRLRAQSQ